MPLTNKFVCFWRKSCHRAAGIILLISGFGLLLPQVTLANWVPTLPLQTSRERHTATVMHSGQVLVAGGYDSNSYYPDNILKSSEIYDPISHSWTNTVGHLSYERFWHTATLLRDGQVLVAGGQSTYLAGEELYHPDPGTWRTVGKLNTSRYGHAATLLPNNLVLVTGGSSGLERRAELYDPVKETWSYTGLMQTHHQFHTATLLLNGQVLVVGGSLYGSYMSELYNPASGLFTYTSERLITGRFGHTATLLHNGLVLVVGGDSGSSILASAELYNPTTQTWSATGSLRIPRRYHTATLLPNGKVLVVGGQGDSSILAGAEIYDPLKQIWTPAGALRTSRNLHTASLLHNRRVLVAGGRRISGEYEISLNSAEILVPCIIGALSLLLLQ